MKLKNLIITAGILLVSFNLIVLVTTYFSEHRLQESRIQLNQENEFLYLTEEAKFHIVQIQQFLTDASLTKEKDSIGEAKDNANALEKVLDQISELKPKLRSQIESIKAGAKELAEVGLEMTLAYWQNGQEAGNLIMKRPDSGLDAKSESLSGLMDQLGTLAKKSQEVESLHLESEMTTFQNILNFVSLASILLNILAFFVIIKRVIPLADITLGLSSSSSELTSTSESLASSARALSASGNQAASATQETAASLEEIRAMLGKTSDGAEELKSKTQTSESLVENGKNQVENIVQQLNRIKSETENLVSNINTSNEEVKSIASVINEIGTKTKVINEIVFQTKLLSFNASVEAARAGEHGKGFAVVAEEVGNLASMSGSAAKEISEMLDRGIQRVNEIIQNNASKIDSTIQTTRRTIGDGLNVAESCRVTFDQIIDQTNSVSQIGNEITSALFEQNKGVTEINSAIGSIEKLSAENSETADEVNQTSQKIQNSALQLEAYTRQMVASINGSNIDVPAALPPRNPSQIPAKTYKEAGDIKNWAA